MKKLVFIIPIAYLLLSLIISLLNRLLWWIIPFIFVVLIGEYITRTMINASTETVTPSGAQETNSEEIVENHPVKQTAGNKRRRKQKEKRLLAKLSNSIESLTIELNDDLKLPETLTDLENSSVLIPKNDDLIIDSTNLSSNCNPQTAGNKRRRKHKEKRLLAKLSKSIECLTTELPVNLKLPKTLTDLEKSSILIPKNEDLSIDITNLSSNFNPSAINYTHTLNRAKNVTRIFNLSDQMSKFYVVNETVFSDMDLNMNDDEFCNYRLYKVMKTEQSSDVHGNEDELTEDDLTEPLFVTVQATKQGYIINNNVYLTREKWHTLLPLSEDLYSCTVCQLQCDGSTVSGHIESVIHASNLSIHSPLKKFDLCIIRKINENLHCGVCNILFPITSYREHENSKSHEENLLSSINKISDMCEDSNKTTQNFNANNIRAPNNAPCRIEGIWSNFWPGESDVNIESENVNRSGIDESCDGIPESYDGVPESCDGIPESHDGIPESCDGRSESCDSMESEPRNETDVSYNFSENFGRNLYTNIRIYEEEIEEYCLPIEGVSYASMASKPKLDLPKFLKIDLGTKEVRVKFEFWHMITPTNPKELYCMVCTESFHLRHKRTHCLSEAHMTALACCAVVGAFEDYLIRDVSDKLYHCGHCNNLQYKNDMQIHIEKYHPINSKRPVKLPAIDQNETITPPLQKPVKKPVESVKKTVESVKKPIESVTKSVQSVKKLDIFANFKFAPFGVEMTVSNLACHTLMLVVDSYYCAICDLMIQGELIEHVYERTHMQLINMTPFIKPFQCNLTRAVRGSLHCAICNILLTVEELEGHNIGTAHTDLLARALGMVKKERPKQEVKYHREEHGEFKTEMDRFLATLPPDTRGVLSRLKIKNHKGEILELSDSSSSTSIGTPESLSSNNSPIRRPDYPPKLIPQFTIYPKNGVEINPHRGVKQTGTIYPRNGVEINPHRWVKQNEVFPPKNVEGIPKGFNPSQMIPLSVIESNLGVKSHIKHQIDQNIQRRPEDLEVNGLKSLHHRVNPNELKQSKNENNDKNGQVKKTKDIGKAKVPEKKTETERKKSESDSEDEDSPFVPDEIVLVKLKSTYFKVTASAYHSLVPLGAGLRRCCACSSRLEAHSLTAHVRSRAHRRTLRGHAALHTGHFVRQMYHTVHCAFCNVTMSRNEVKMHLEWPPHIERRETASKKLNKKDLKDLLKHAKEISVETQKGTVHSNVPESIHIITYVSSTREDWPDSFVEEKCEKKSQMIILGGQMMKISFESWHGVLVTKNGIKCIICQHELTTDGLQRHLDTKYHSVALGIVFEKQHYPALIRKINKNTVNCMTCNLELPNDDSLIDEHIHGRKHVKNHNTIKEKTSHTDSYSDCYKYPITL